MRVYADLETRWDLDLCKFGATACASHPTAGVNCIGYAVDDSGVAILPYEYSFRGAALSSAFLPLVDNPANELVCHNAQFELTVFKHVLGFEPKCKVICTMAKAAYYGYPRGLDDCAKALQLPLLKDVQGAQVMKKLVTGKYTPADAPEDFQRLYEYCKVDVEVMRMIDRALPDLPPREQQLWELDCAINMRGIPLDMVAINNAVWLRDELARQADEQIANLTGGYVQTIGQVAKIQEFAKSCGVELPDCTADTVTKALQMSLPPVVRAVLELRQDAGLSSLAKYEVMQRQQVGGRYYQGFDVYGAHTLRFASNGAQWMNLARSTNPELWAELLSKSPRVFRKMFAKPQQKLKEAIRGVIKAPDGEELLTYDLSQIEARATAHLAGEQKLVDIFASGRDVYAEYGTDMWGRKITKADLFERTAAKASVLAFGFAGGIGAGQRTGEIYDLDWGVLADLLLPNASPAEWHEAKRCYDWYMKSSPAKPLSERNAMAVDLLKQRYRKDFPNIVNYWDELEAAFLSGGWAGPIRVDAHPSGLRVINLPCGRQLFYHSVRVSAKGEYSYQARKGREHLWKGVLMENCAQAVNAAISAFYMLLVEKEVGPIVHHNHDESTVCIATSQADAAEVRLREALAARPPGYDGLPLAYEIVRGVRYGK